MRIQLPIGASDFAQLRREGWHYVDKTGLVTELVRTAAPALLLPRPRRFGKTLNLSMLRAFFEPGEDQAALFQGLRVLSAGPDVLAHMGTHPVIFLSFKDVKYASWAESLEAMRALLASEVLRHRPSVERATLEPEERRLLADLGARAASPVELASALRLLSRALTSAAGQPVVILIDEYDTPLHAAFVRGYYDEAVDFFRAFLGAGLKDNPYLFRGVITGILRVARESIFSGLNNLAVHTLLSSGFTEHFGFTEPEVAELARLTGQVELLPTLQRWYDGYRVGAHRIYNPWSVLNQLSRPGEPPQPWWVNTASDDILRELLIEAGLGIHDELSGLLRGEPIRRPISEDIVLRDVRRDPDALWSFLLFSGYLTADAPLSRDEDGHPDSPLRIPNHEVRGVYRSVFSGWLRRSLAGGSEAPRRLGAALLSGDEEGFRALLQQLMLTALSHHDVGGRRPEAVYQAFLVGLLLQLETTHDVRSNRESGHGRYDVAVRPRAPGQPGAVLELKVLDAERGERPDEALDRALAQIEARDYGAELRAAGAAPMWRWAAVFDGKRVWVRAVASD